ncbi:MAG: hypothetical protein ABEJ99_01780 [Candidatus Nanohaloarchaea archaeon]
MGQEDRRLSVEVLPEDFYGDIHSTLPHAIYRRLEEGYDDLIGTFGIEDPNRVVTESEVIGPGVDV